MLSVFDEEVAVVLVLVVLEPTGTAAKTGLVRLDNWSSLHAVITNNEAYPSPPTLSHSQYSPEVLTRQTQRTDIVL